MTKAQANAGSEHDAQLPQIRGAEPPVTDGSREAGRETREDTSNPRALLLDHALETYAGNSRTLSTPAKEGAATGEDGFSIVDSNNETNVAKATGLDKAIEQSNHEQGKPADQSERKADSTKHPGDSLSFVSLGSGETYVGEFIKVNARPLNYEVPAGESLEQIARKHLGPQASKGDVEKHMTEISLANPVVGEKGNAYLGKKGDIIKLPGHTVDGATLHKDSRGTLYSVTEDGKVRVSYLDGTGFERTPDADGGVTRKYFGPKPEDNYTVKLDKDGVVERNDRVDPAHKPAQDLASETKRLEDLAGKTMGIKTEREQFKRDMQQFAERARKAGLPELEVAQTFAEVSRILEAQGAKQPMTSRERVRLSIGIMRGAAYPTSNNQGEHEICSMSMGENQLYVGEPSTVARTLADIATRSKFVAADGTVVRMDPQDLRAHGEGALNEGRGINKRSYSSQIFQVAAANAFHTSANERTVPPGEKRYFQVKPENADDTGERMADFSKHPAEIEKSAAPGNAASANGFVDTMYLLTGKKNPNVLLESEHIASLTSDKPKGTVFHDATELIEQLKALKAQGKPMAVGVMIHANQDPFLKLRSEEHGPFSKKTDLKNFISDLHFVNVVGFDEKNNTVQIDNQWGDDKDMIDKPISVYELYDATQRTTGNQWISRLEDRWGSQSDERNAEQLKHIMTTNFYNWAIEHEAKGIPVDQRDVDQSMQKYLKLVERLQPKQAESVRKVVEKLNKDWEESREAMRKSKSGQ